MEAAGQGGQKTVQGTRALTPSPSTSRRGKQRIEAETTEYRKVRSVDEQEEGWYPHPVRENVEAYWDGSMWTGDTRQDPKLWKPALETEEEQADSEPLPLYIGHEPTINLDYLNESMIITPEEPENALPETTETDEETREEETYLEFQPVTPWTLEEEKHIPESIPLRHIGDKDINHKAILGLALAFMLPPVGAFISYQARSEIKRQGDKGNALAVAGTLIGTLLTLALLGFLVL
jgi:hypothetical protein